MEDTSNEKSKPVAQLTENANRNHEVMFPNFKSVLKGTDPELIEIFDNWGFDEVIELSMLDTKTRVMMILSSTLGSQALTEYKIMVGAALNVGVTPVEIKEILYQATAYVGMAKAVDFLNATNEVFGCRGVALPLEGQSTTTRETRLEKGLATQKAIFGGSIDQMYEQSPKDQLHIQRFLSAHCFGDFYTRNGLDLKTREMVTLSILIAMGGTESQIKGHIKGNLNVGSDRAILLSLMTQLLPWVGYPRTLNAIGCLNEIVPFQDHA
jgi:4-carboxymuconolactone decarboxylase